MKKLILLISLVTTSLAFGFTETVYVNGSDARSGYCSKNMYSFCLRNLQEAAKSGATRDADMSCRVRQGRLDQFSASCTEFCNPSFPSPHDAENIYANCTVRCNFRCDIPN